jgi:drug/metabolite transporter (DMT)-like permease
LATVIGKYPFFGQTGHRLDLALRAISGTISLTTIYMAYRLMPLADASTIHFSSPVFVTIFAYFMLKEPLTILQLITGTITLTGVVIIAKPEFIFGSESEEVHENRLEGTILAVIAALTAAFSMVNLRKLKTTPGMNRCFHLDIFLTFLSMQWQLWLCGIQRLLSYQDL